MKKNTKVLQAIKLVKNLKNMDSTSCLKESKCIGYSNFCWNSLEHSTSCFWVVLSLLSLVSVSKQTKEISLTCILVLYLFLWC
jgi:hypothetical protein